MFGEVDSHRLAQMLATLTEAGLRDFAITGGVAAVLQGVRPGNAPPLNDLDLVVADVAALPAGLADRFLVNHFHPAAPAGKLLLQLVEPRFALRIDIFGAVRATLERARNNRDPRADHWLVTREDLACRALRSTLPLVTGRPVDAKHWRDLERLAEVVDRGAVEAMWREHCGEDHSLDFGKAGQAVLAAGRLATDWIDPVYCTDPSVVCDRCATAGCFPIASRERVMAVLGYC